MLYSTHCYIKTAKLLITAAHKIVIIVTRNHNLEIVQMFFDVTVCYLVFLRAHNPFQYKMLGIENCPQVVRKEK